MKQFLVCFLKWRLNFTSMVLEYDYGLVAEQLVFPDSFTGAGGVLCWVHYLPAAPDL
jgi:hypothetical protein